MTIQSLSFLEVFKDASGGNTKTPQKEFLEEGEIPVVDQGQGLIAGFVNERSRVCNAKPPVIVFGDHTRVIKYVDFEFAMGADGTKVLVPKVESDTKYLYYALKAVRIPAAGYSRHYKFLKETQIPLPPLAEQKRIAGILDAADALRTKRRESLALLHTLLQSTFLDMFGDPVTNPMRWELRRLDELGEVQTGSTPPSKLEGMFNGEIPFITPGDLREAWIEPSRTVTKAGAEKSRTVRRGATLVCCIGATIGKMGKASDFSAFNQQINAVSWGDTVADDFGLELMRFFKAKIARDGASTTLPILKKSLFQKISVPNPPLPLQRRFAAIVESVEKQKSRCRAHLDELDTLFASLQQRAFNGELLA